MNKIKRVVSIGAHSLDAELLGGPLIIKYASIGAKCSLLHVTQGRLEDPKASEEEKKNYLEELLKQNEQASKILGADFLWLGYVSSNMPTLDEFSLRLKRYFMDEEVDLVITHWRGSMHPRHINTHDAVTKAIKEMRREGSNIKLLYGETFEDLVGFIPQAYYTMSEEETKKWFDALNSYQVFKGEINDFPYQNYYKTNLQIREIESGSKAPTVCYMYASLIENEI
ncbi:MAG: PIG-L family deacetylase [Eubacteriales bacterium]|nr:PIG-L family deacetylase [Eubacteriales bacterium]